MKKIVLVLAMVTMVGAMSAQELTFGIKGGANMSNLTGKGVKDSKMKLGFNVGVAADYEFAPNMAIQSGLYFMTKGAKYKGEILGIKGEYTMNPMYLQVPVHFAYKIDVMPATRVVLHAGPYVAYGIAGKSTLKVSAGGESGKTDGTNLFGDKGSLKAFDAGLGLGVGAEFGQFLVDLGWDMGLTNISKSSNGSVKNQNAYLSVGYRF